MANQAWWSVPARWSRHLSTRATYLTLMSLAYSIVLALTVVTLLTPPRLSLVLATPSKDTARVAWVLPSSTLWERGVRPGDNVLVLDGRPPRPAQAGIWTGEKVGVRAGDGSTILIDTGMIRRDDTAWPLLLLSPWFLLLGALVYLRAPYPAIGRTTYALFASAAFALALAPASISSQPLAVVAEWVMIVLFAACFIFFCLSFPAPRGSTRLRLLLGAPPLLAAMLSLATPIWPMLYEGTALLRASILLGYMIMGAGLLLFSAIQAREDAARRGLIIVGAGTLVSVLPFTGLYLAPALLGRSPLMTPEHAILALAFLPVSFAYAILRHNVLPISLLQRWLVRASIWAVVLTVATGIVYARHWLFGALPEPLHSLVLAAVLMLILGVSFGWLGSRAQILVDRLIFKDSYDYRAALRALSRELSRTSDLETLGKSLPDTLRRLMNLDWAVLLVEGRQGSHTYGIAGTYQPVMLPDLSAAARKVRARSESVPLGSGAVLLVPLRTHDAIVGHLCLGPKSNGEPFRAEDRDLLGTLGGQVAGVVHTAQLLVELRAQVRELDMLNERLQRAQEDERASLAADIHDEPLQTALRLQRQIMDCGRQDDATAAPISLSQTLIDQLRRVCAAIRPAALDDLGLYAALDELAQEQSERSSVPILLDIDPAIADLALPPGGEIVLYRAAQEAITNGLRHAHPRTIKLSMRQQANMVQLAVADDGSGFTPERFDRLVAQGHLGLAGLHERVQRVGGRLHVASAPGAGTTVQVELPLVEVLA